MKYKFLIIDDNLDFAKNLREKLQQHLSNFVKEINICNDGESGIKELMEIKPDILLLDLNLPKLNGLTILEKTKNINCSIIVVSGEVSLINHIRILDNNNIKKILIKPFHINILIDEIDYICSEKIYDTFQKKVEKELNIFDFNKSSIGYRYLIECLILVCKEPHLLNNIERELFPQVAKVFGVKKTQTIKWCMQKTVKSMIKYTDKKTIACYFPSVSNPSLKLFITTLNTILLT